MNTTNLCFEAIQARLDECGFAVVKTESFANFHTLCSSLGRVSQTTEVRLKAGGTQYPHCADEVPFHTDHPHVPIVAWYCEQQDDHAGANLLVDSKEVVCGMLDAETAALTTIRLRVFHHTESHPLLTNDPYRFYWLPVVIDEVLKSADSMQALAIASFRRELAERMKTQNVLSVRLQSGEALFVNNHRMLHGRRAIAQDSARFLTRVYVMQP
jgi:hypothetical protein